MSGFFIAFGIVLFCIGMLRAMGEEGTWLGVGIAAGGLLSAYLGAPS